jgi:hypothetical protein
MQKVSNTGNRIFFLVIIFYFILMVSCRTLKPDILSILQEDVSFNKLKDNHFNYVYYKLNGFEFEDSKMTFCKGTYIQIGKNEYVLNPDTFDAKLVDVNINRDSLLLKTQVRIKVNTDIDKYRAGEYKIILHYDSLSLKFKGINFDTILFSKDITKFTIEIILPDFYISGHPSAIYKSITTRPITINKGDFFNIKVPITRDYFYYQNIGKIRFKEMGRYYLFLDNEKKINKSLRIK